MSRRLGRGHCPPGNHTRFRTARGARLVIEQIRVQALRVHRPSGRLHAVRCPHCHDWRISHRNQTLPPRERTA